MGTLETELFTGISNEIEAAREESIYGGSPFLATIRRIAPHFVEQNPDSPYLYISSFSELKKNTSHTTTRPSIKTRTLRQSSQNSLKQYVRPKTQRPPPIEFHDKNGKPWILKCVCNIQSEGGLLLTCEKCGTWQHAICMGYNENNLPEKYYCDECANKIIRCKCERNLDFRFTLLKCSGCGYYIHKRCENIGFGAMPSGKFLCSFCGKWEFTYDTPPLNGPIEQRDPATIMKPLIPSPLFADFFNDLIGKSISLKEFCELYYGKFRSIFFVSHPLYQTTVSKKKRNNLQTAFFDASEYIFSELFRITRSEFIEYMDRLILEDLYKPHLYGEDDKKECELTENAQFDAPNYASACLNYPTNPKNATILWDDMVIDEDVPPDHFMFRVDGLIGDLEEFDSNEKIDESYFAVSDTRFVIDTSRCKSNPVHNVSRTCFGNCICKLYLAEGKFNVGLFSKVEIKKGTKLTISFDFMPSMMEDIGKWYSFRFTKPSPQEEPLPKPVREEKEVSPKIKKLKRGKKKQKIQPIPVYLFKIFEDDTPGEYCFRIGDIEPEEKKFPLFGEAQLSMQIPQENAVVLEPEFDKVIQDATNGINYQSYVPMDHIAEMKVLLGL